MKRILVPYDFSEYANYALDFACQIAAANNSHVTLFHVIETPHAAGFNTRGEVTREDQESKLYFLKLIQKTEEKMAEIVADKKYDTVVLDQKIVVGTAFKSIGEEVSDRNADIIVMGTKGTSNLEEFFVGSNTEKVVRFATCPVIAIPGPCTLASISDIAFATNPDEGKTNAVKMLHECQQLFNAKIHLVWVNTIHDSENPVVMTDRLETLAKENSLENYKVHVCRAVTTEEGILRFATEHNMDMVAMGTHGYKGLSHLFLGSIAEDVVNHSDKPVWTFNMRP